MAYVEVRKEGKLVMQKQVDDELAQKGFRIRVGTAGNVHLKLGEAKTVGDYVVTLYQGQPSEDAYHAVDDLKKAVGAILPINTPNAQNVTVSADAGDAGRAGEQRKYPQIEGFEITGRLGEGGMGTVWRGVQLSTKRQVAIKFLSTHRFTSQKAKTRFEREVSMAAKLNHPNIAQVYDSGVHRGVYYYAMELIEGIHLDKYVQREELSPKEIVKLMRDVCDAVCHAHQHGIIHRDLKPSNILVTPHGKPTVVDFGLAKSFENEHEDATISIEGDITGTPAYMAPEQAAGRIKDISERTDVYAMGVIMFQLTAGCLPHDISGSHYDIFRRIVEEDVKSPRTINPAIDNELDSILLTCLAREPENRYPSASVLVKDIDNYLNGQPLLSKSFSTTYRVVKNFRRNRFKIALGGIFATMLAAIILLLCFIYSSRPDSTTEPTSQQDSTEGIVDPNQLLTANKGAKPNLQKDKQGSTEVVIDRDKPVTANKGEIVTNSIGMKLVYIPAGNFLMGSPLSADEVFKQYGYPTNERDNAPTHPVKITGGFYLGQMEVTVDQFSKFVKETGYETAAEQRGSGFIHSVVQSKMISVQGLNWRNPGIEQEANHPVVQISWGDAMAFCQWLSKKEGKTYRLPTEAQWEYACRAGSQTEFYWGNDTETGIAHANMCDQSAQKWANTQGGFFSCALKSNDRVATTAPVGSFKPNAFGLYDMHGNVWEWCADWYGSEYDAENLAENPQGPTSGTARTQRGGSWNSSPSRSRCAFRGQGNPSLSTFCGGFRVCLFDGQTPPRPKEIDEAVVGQNPPQSLSLQRNQPPAAISINGKPFFVICARSAVPEEFEEYKKAGFNTVYTHLPSNPSLDEAQKHGLYAIPCFAYYKCKDGLFLPEFWQEAQQQITTWKSHPALLAWSQSPSLLQIPRKPSEIKKLFDLLAVKSPDKPRFLAYNFDDTNWQQLYPYNAYTDVMVLENFSIRRKISATALWFQHAFEMADGKPVWYIVHANLWKNKSSSVRELRASTYLGINHGTTGILIDGFQNRLWEAWGADAPGMADPRLADLRKEAIRIAGELKTLSPAILAGSFKDSKKISGNSQIDFQAFADPGNTKLYFIAVNPSNQLVTSSFFIPDGLQDSIEVLNEGRTLQHANSQFSDSFEPQETHIYILKTKETTPPEKWHKAMEDARREFLSINDRESADFVGTILDSLDKPQGMSPSALAAHANRLESKTRELVRKGSMESAAIHNYAMWSARVMPGPGADAPAREGQQRRTNSPSRADGLVLYMPFDTPPANSMVLDESGTGNHGKLEGAQWVSEGHFGGAYRFRITNLTDRIVIPDSDSLNPRKVTVTAWIKTSDTDGFWNRIIDKDFRKGYVLCLGGDFNGKGNRGKVGFETNSKYIASDRPMVDDLWHHVAGTFDGTILKLYVNGMEKEQKSKNSTPITGNHWDLCIGNSVVDYGTGEFLGFDGLIDEVRIYNRVLSAEEIQTLANATQAGADIANPAPLIENNRDSNRK